MKKILFSAVFVILSLSITAQKKARASKFNTGQCSNPQISRSGQRTTYTYNYDFKTMNKSDDCHVTPRHNKDVVYINLKNINTLLYNIDPSGTITNLPLEKISIFDSLAGSLKAGTVSSATNPVDAAPAPTVKVAGNKKRGTPTDAPRPYYTEKKIIETNQNYIKTHFAQWVADMQKLEHFVRLGKNVPGLVAGECCEQNMLMYTILTEPNVLQFDPSVFSGAAPDTTDFPKLIAAVGSVSATLVKNIKDELANMLTAKKLADEQIAAIRKDCREKKIRDTEKECDVDYLEDNYPDDFAKAVKVAQDIDAAKIADAAEQLRALLIKISSDANFKYNMLSPFQIEGDTYDAKLKFTPKSQYAANVKTDSIVIPLLVKGKFEWAIGPALNFHVSGSLFDQSFRIDSARNLSGIARADTFSITKNRNSNKLIPSVGVMAHFYWQKHNAITPGIVLGLSTSVADIKDLRAYLGLSCLLGGLSDKVFINGGYAFGWSDRLKGNLSEGDNPKSQIPYTGDKIASPEQLVEKSFHGGLFFGVTYKLSK